MYLPALISKLWWISGCEPRGVHSHKSNVVYGLIFKVSRFTKYLRNALHIKLFGPVVIIYTIFFLFYVG